jgi:Domain of unknown function (DUF4276)
MNRVLNIVVEGPTERDFVTQCMMPYFADRGLHNIRPIGIETRPSFKGGDVRYEARYKPTVNTILRGKEEMIVTSLIDFYKLRTDFPKYSEAQKIVDKNKQVEFLEQACFNDIGDRRFIPYIQLHEFEALLFTKWDGFADFQIPEKNKKLIQDIIKEFPNPELINERPEFAPSKRLEKLIIPKYEKPFHGNYIALENGFDSILDKCPRFKNWIEILIVEMNK